MPPSYLPHTSNSEIFKPHQFVNNSHNPFFLPINPPVFKKIILHPLRHRIYFQISMKQTEKHKNTLNFVPISLYIEMLLLRCVIEMLLKLSKRSFIGKHCFKRQKTPQKQKTLTLPKITFFTCPHTSSDKGSAPSSSPIAL